MKEIIFWYELILLKFTDRFGCCSFSVLMTCLLLWLAFASNGVCCLIHKFCVKTGSASSTWLQYKLYWLHCLLDLHLYFFCEYIVNLIWNYSPLI
jgi:hypothetical protein